MHNTTKRVVAVLLSVVMVLSVFGGMTFTASASGTGKAIELVTNGTAANIAGAQASSVWFGNYMQSSADSKEPVKWRVLSNADGKLFLLADQNLDVVQYNEEYTSVTWADCTLRKWLNGYENHPYDDTFIGSAFTAKELNAVADSAVENANNPDLDTNGGDDTTDKVFLLSIAQATNTDYGFEDNYDLSNTRIATNTGYVANGGHTGGGMSGVGRAYWWWLRSPGRSDSYAAIVNSGGYLYSYGYDVDYDDVAVRPAFKMNLNSVLFTSAAVGGKTGSGLTAVGQYAASDWKLTVLDSSRSSFNAHCLAFIRGVCKFAYSGAQTGTNEKISAMIVNADGIVTYYGVLCDAEAGENTVTVDVSGKLNDGDKLYVFNEQINGDKKTDYSSALVDVTQVTPLNTIMLQTNNAAINILGAQISTTVWFGNYKQSSDGNGGYNVEPVKWRVLSNADGKLFLLADQNLDVVQYNEEYTSVTWADCTLRKWLNGYENHPYDDTFIGSAFTAKELNAVADSAVENANNPSYNTPGGNDTTDKVFLLSIAEAMNTDYGFEDNYDPSNTRIATNTGYVENGGHTGGGMNVVGAADYWWLRSPGRKGTLVAIVCDDGELFYDGDTVVDNRVAVRPAFKMNLNSVLFTSAAVGGKTASGLTAVEEYTGSDWKLTVLDSSRSDFTASCTGIENGVCTITYSGATTGTNEKISAMIVDVDGIVTYYGVLCDAAAGTNTLTLDVSGKLNDGDTLYVFNEQSNGDKKTDYSSALVDVTPAQNLGPSDEITATIDDQIGVNIKLDMDDAHAGAKTVEITFRGETMTYDVEGESGQACLSFDIAPAYAAEEFTVSVDGEPIEQNIHSVKEYCEALMETYPVGSEVYALADALLRYAQAANDYFELGDEIADISDLESDFTWSYAFNNETSLNIYSLSFMALTQPEYRFYVKGLSEEQALAYNEAGVSAAYADANIAETPNARFVKTAQGKVLLEVTGITAQTMDKPIVVTIEGVGTLTFAGNDFVKLMVASGGDTMAPLGVALYDYGVAAAAYEG